jgi:aminopeptidase N
MYPGNLTRAEARHRSMLIKTAACRVEVDLSGRNVPDPQIGFISTSTVSFTARAAGQLHIDVIADALLSAQLDGSGLDPANFTGSRLPFEVAEGDHELSVTALFRYSRCGEGLHRFVDPVDDRVYLYTQFEVSNARRVYACFEQPDLKARFSIEVIAPSGWTVVSNGALLRTEPVGNDGRGHDRGGFSRHVFAETPPISTYLTALAAGDYHEERSTHWATSGEVPMAILCRRSIAQHLDADRIREVTTTGFDLFEKHFGFGYPFGKYDQVFVPEYNSGAMENVGCIVLRDEYVFRSRQTEATYQSRANTILHELSHMWFGDLVTMRWWDDLWLKESFATWAASFAASETAADPSAAWSMFCNGNKNWAYRQDQLPSTHPISADMVDLEAVEQNFDGITYAKGASVLVQLVAFVGREAFLEGVRAYFAEHAYGNTELADLLVALERASGRDLSGWSGQWLETAGVNTLSADFATDEAKGFTSFAIEQTATPAWPTLRSHRVAVGLYQLIGDNLTRVGRVEVDIAGASTTAPELVGIRQPDLVLPNDDDLTYAKVRLDRRSLRTAVEHINKVTSPLTRALLWGATWDMCRDAELPAADYVDLVIRGVGTESDLTAVRYVLGQAQGAANSYAPPGVRAELLNRWQDGVGELLARSAPGSDHQLALARAFAAASQDAAAADLLAAWLRGTAVPDGLTIDPELRWIIVANLARLGRLTDDDISAELERDNTITGAEQAAGARAAQPTAAAKASAWRMAVEEDTIPNGTQNAICLKFWQRDQDEVLSPYLHRYFDAAEAISASAGPWASRGMSLRNNVLRYLFPWPVDKQPFVDELDDWLANTELTGSVRRTIEERRDDLLRALRCQAAGALVG